MGKRIFSILATIITFSSLLLTSCDIGDLETIIDDFIRTESPVINPVNERINSGTEIEIISLEEDVKVYYTIDGSEPTESSTLYSAPFTLNDGEYTVKAVAKSGEKEISYPTAKRYIVGEDVRVKPVITTTPQAGQYGAAMTVTLKSSNSDDVIYYTTDGSTPDESSDVYSAPIAVNSTTTISAFGKASDGQIGDVYQFEFEIVVDTEAPVMFYTPSNTTTTETYLVVSLIANDNIDENPTIYYTLDGSVPTTSSAVYSNDLIIGADLRIRAFAKDSAGNESGIISIDVDVAEAGDSIAPTMSYSPSNTTTTASSLVVQLSATDNVDPNPAIYYTLDGSVPTTSSARYSSSLNITEDLTIRAFAKDAAGNESSIVNIPVDVSEGNSDTEAPVLTHSPSNTSTSASSLTVELSATDNVDPNPAIYYTTNGSAPTTSSTRYSSGINVTSNLTIKAIAVDASGNQTMVKNITVSVNVSSDSYYKTNPNGQKGKSASITIDGSFSDWTNDMIVAQGVANDDPRMFRGSHEGPVYDLYALYAAWDNDNLYLMWQYTNVTDIADSAQGFPISDNGKPWNGNIPISIAFDVDPSKETDGLVDGTTNSVWANGTFNTFANGTDHLAMFSSKPGVGEPAIFTMNSNGSFDYEDANVKGFTDNGISYQWGDHNHQDHIYGINSNGWSGYTPADLDDPSKFIDFLDTNHDTNQETCYEMKIPLAVFGITKSQLENNGIGVMLISTFGQSATDSLPHDNCTLDNALEPYGPEASTSHEKEDADNFTSPMARVGS